jgi:hypothetical protein
MAVVWLVVGWMWLRLAGRSERFSGSRRGSCSYSGAGYPKTLFVARPLSIGERGARLGVAQATNRGVVVREPGMLGPPR